MTNYITIKFSHEFLIIISVAKYGSHLMLVYDLLNIHN